jgi:predicted acylesterase/phospholipase RssA
MNVERNGVGLVLSGGGAKGAYQAGVARALA